MRIGIFGGTFNPVHIGHLRPVEEARIYFNLNKVIFIPAKIPPHKNINNVVSPFERLKILKLAVEDNPFFEVSDIELHFEGKSFTYNTLIKLTQLFHLDDLYLIIGKDSFYSFKTWHRWNEILKMVNLIVLNRKISEKDYPDELEFAKSLGYNRKENFYENSYNKTLQFFNNSIIEVSSTKIRENFKSGISNRYLIPEKALQYIIKKNLYV